MELETDQVLQAIEIASDPSRAPLHQQALDFLGTVQSNSATTWKLALALFAESKPGGGRNPPQARFWALRVLDDFFDNRSEPLDDDSFRLLRETLLAYIQSEYLFGEAESAAPFLRNKFSHTLTLLFLCTYIEQWPSFFTDIFALIRPASEPSASTVSFNHHVSLLFFHLLLEISGEVADQIIKAARAWSQERHVRDAKVRDAVRERDAAQINEAVLTIVADSSERLRQLRSEDGHSLRDLEAVEEMVDWGIRAFGSYVQWIDINLTVTPSTIPLLFTLLSDESLPLRLAASAALGRIIAKGLKEPGDKLQLIKVLSLGPVLDALETKTREQQVIRGNDVDEGEESYREALGKLLNHLGLELMKLIEDSQAAPEVVIEANPLLEQVLPIMLRFMSDVYDDTSSTIFPLLTSMLSRFKKARKITTEPLDEGTRSFIRSLLGVILKKMKWDEEADPEDTDEEDKMAFEVMRKELRSFLDSVLMIDHAMVTNAVRTLATSRLAAFQSGPRMNWTDAELAVYLVFLFGDINKAGGKGRAAFCHAPAVPKEERKQTDYSDYPLTEHGEMLYALVQSGISSYPHPAVSMQFFETAARYGDFFKVRKQCIMPTLQAMVDTRGLHSSHSLVRNRVYYLFHRFIKECRNEISPDLARELVLGMRDLLTIEVELPELENPEQQDLLTEAMNNLGLFDSQLYLFETVGILLSLLFRNVEQQTSMLLSIIDPLLNELETSFTAARNSQDVAATLKVHHIIMALGNIAKGFPDYPSPVPDGWIAPPVPVFDRISNAIIVCLDAMKIVRVVRDAARFAFARIFAMIGPHVTHYIPPLMVNLLTHFDPPELSEFMHFIGLLVHRLKQDIYQVLDELMAPLSAHITQIISQPGEGTDDVLARNDMRKSYLGLLNTIMTNNLHRVFLSERNKPNFETLLATAQSIAEDLSDPSTQKVAFQFLGRAVTIWGSADKDNHDSVPGFERFIYDRLVPLAFTLPSNPDFNPKDGQSISLLSEIAAFLQLVEKARGGETYEFLASVYLPSKNWPPELAAEFGTKLRDLDAKAFRKYFTDFVRTSRSS